MRPLPYVSGKRAVVCVTAQWKMSEYVRGREWEESCMQILNRQLCLLRDMLQMGLFCWASGRH